MSGGVEEHRRFARNPTLPDRLGLPGIVRGPVQDVCGQGNEVVRGGELNGRVGGKRALPTHWPVSWVRRSGVGGRQRRRRIGLHVVEGGGLGQDQYDAFVGDAGADEADETAHRLLGPFVA